MENNQAKKLEEVLLEELKGEYFISPFYSQNDFEVVKGYILDGIDSIKNNVSDDVDFENDRQARALVKNYAKYALENLKDEFDIRYAKNYLELQINYATKV